MTVHPAAQTPAPARVTNSLAAMDGWEVMAAHPELSEDAWMCLHCGYPRSGHTHRRGPDAGEWCGDTTYPSEYVPHPDYPDDLPCEECGQLGWAHTPADHRHKPTDN